MSNIILITGATGQVGSHVVRQLSTEGKQFRALVRSQEKAAAMDAPSVEAVIGDFSQSETLDAALTGIEKLFLLSVGSPDQVELQGNVIEAAQRAGVRHIVKLSILGTSPDAPTGLGRWHAQTEEQIRESGIAYTFLRPGSFMQNLMMSADTIKTQGAIYAPMRDGKFSPVDARDIAAVAVATLTEDGHKGKTYDITGPEAVSYADVAKKISAAIGKTVTYVDVPPEAARQGMLDAGLPEWVVDDLSILNEIYASGQAAEVSPVVAEVAKKEPITFDQFARDYAEAFK